jgi:3',5'-cyclic AMP phosphodiesterase CpdA
MKKKRSALLIAIAVLLVLPAVLPGCGGGVRPPTHTSSEPESSVPGEPARDGPSFSFIVCGDPQNNYEVFDRVLQAASSVDFIIIAGDMTGSGTATEFQTFTDRMAASGVTYYCVPGNHDVATSPVDQNYRRFCGPPYQSFSYENSHFLLLDNSTPSQGFYAAQREWAAADLESAKGNFEHVFAVCHVPPGYPYSSRFRPEEKTGIEANRELVPLLSGGGVGELFCGHWHAYEQKEEDGLLITITGGAGAPLHVSEKNGGYHHYVLVDINGKQRSQKVVRI